MFKHKLQFVLKDDIYQRDVWKEVVLNIHDTCVKSHDFIYGRLEFDERTAGRFVSMVEMFDTLTDIYIDNKFSPASAGLMRPQIDLMRKHTLKIIEIFEVIIKMNNVMKGHPGDDTDDPDINLIKSTYEENCRRLSMLLDDEIDLIGTILEYIDTRIAKDIVKIKSGVDPIREYKRRLKRIPSNKDLIQELHVQYKILSPGDRDFLEKEKIKNGK